MNSQSCTVINVYWTCVNLLAIPPYAIFPSPGPSRDVQDPAGNVAINSSGILNREHITNQETSGNGHLQYAQLAPSGLDAEALLRENIELYKRNEILMRKNAKALHELRAQEMRIQRQELIMGKYRNYVGEVHRVVQENPAFLDSGSDISDGEGREDSVAEMITQHTTRFPGSTLLQYPLAQSHHSSVQPMQLLQSQSSILPQQHLPPALMAANERRSRPRESLSIPYPSDELKLPSISPYFVPSDQQPMPASPNSSTHHTGNSGSRKRNLDPGAKKKKPSVQWTTEDEENFMTAYNQYGKAWKLLESMLPGKTREQIQSHGSYLIKTGKLPDIPPKTGPKVSASGSMSVGTPVSSVTTPVQPLLPPPA